MLMKAEKCDREEVSFLIFVFIFIPHSSKINLKMTSIPFSNFGSDCSELFADHNLNEISFSKQGSIQDENGTFTVNAKTNSIIEGGTGISWDANFATNEVNNSSSNNNNFTFKLSYDHKGDLHKEMNIKLNENTNFSITPKWNSKTGQTKIAEICAKYQNDKVNFQIKSEELPAWPDLRANLNYEITTKPFYNHKCLNALHFGLTGDFIQASKSFENTKFGFNFSKGNKEISFVSNDLCSFTPQTGNASMFLTLAEHTYFKSYGLQYNGGLDGKLAIAAETNFGEKYKLGHDGTFNILKSLKVNQGVTIKLAAETNLTKISKDGFKFGAAFSFE